MILRPTYAKTPTLWTKRLIPSPIFNNSIKEKNASQSQYLKFNQVLGIFNPLPFPYISKEIPVFFSLHLTNILQKIQDTSCKDSTCHHHQTAEWILILLISCVSTYYIYFSSHQRPVASSTLTEVPNILLHPQSQPRQYQSEYFLYMKVTFPFNSSLGQWTAAQIMTWKVGYHFPHPYHPSTSKWQATEAEGQR